MNNEKSLDFLSTDEIDSINNFYNSVDKPIIDEFCKNNYIKDLLKMSTQNNVSIVTKKNKRWIIKDKDKIINQCKRRKRKEINNTVSILAQLAKSCSNNSIIEIKKLNYQLEDRISNIDKMIDHISISTEEEYIECYSNS
jgi:hypothetical protein